MNPKIKNALNMKAINTLVIGAVVGILVYLFAVVAVDAMTRPVVLKSVSSGCLGVYEEGKVSPVYTCDNLPKSFSLEYRP